VASCNLGTSAPEHCERALCDIVRRLQQHFDITDLRRTFNGNDNATKHQEHNHAIRNHGIRSGGIRPGAGHG